VTYHDAVLGQGTLGSGDVLRLPAGDYVVKLDSIPPQRAQVSLESSVRQTVEFVPIEERKVETATSNDIEYSACEESAEVLAAAGTQATRHAPAKIAPSRAKSGGKGAPKARREALFDVSGGSVEIWRNLRPDRKSDWGVIVRHPSVGAKPRMIHSGNDRAVAAAIAKSTRDMLDDGEL
jgi:hypothetical protein